MKITLYKVVSDSEGVIVEYEDEDVAVERSEVFNDDSGLPDDHSVVETTEEF